MARFLVASVGMLALALMTVPASAEGCPGESACACAHGAEQAQKAKPQAEAKPAPKAQKAQPKVRAATQPPQEPAASEPSPTREVQGALLQEIDVLVADKCSCHSAADCTCKKGQCKCKACKHKRMVEPVKGNIDALKLPTEARWEATSGVFI